MPEGECSVTCLKRHADGQLIEVCTTTLVKLRQSLLSPETLVSCWSLEQLKLWDQKFRKDSEAGLLD